MKPRILYAEDNDISRELTQAALTAAGFDVVAVAGGQAACEAFAGASDQGEPFALLLLDVHMPDMTGFAVARAVRALPQGRDVLIVILTGSVGETDGDAADELGVAMTLLKPITRKKLASLQALLDQPS